MAKKLDKAAKAEKKAAAAKALEAKKAAKKAAAEKAKKLPPMRTAFRELTKKAAAKDGVLGTRKEIVAKFERDYPQFGAAFAVGSYITWAKAGTIPDCHILLEDAEGNLTTGKLVPSGKGKKEEKPAKGKKGAKDKKGKEEKPAKEKPAKEKPAKGKKGKKEETPSVTETEQSEQSEQSEEE